jgi:hypothetical protein
MPNIQGETNPFFDNDLEDFPLFLGRCAWQNESTEQMIYFSHSHTGTTRSNDGFCACRTTIRMPSFDSALLKHTRPEAGSDEFNSFDRPLIA